MEHAAERPVLAIDLGGATILAAPVLPDREVAARVVSGIAEQRLRPVHDRIGDPACTDGSRAAPLVTAQQGAPSS